MRRRDERGVAAAEFALILPFLAMIIWAIFQVGGAYSEVLVLKGAARDGARLAAMGKWSDGEPVTEADVLEEVTTAVGPPFTIDAVDGGIAVDACTEGTEDARVEWTELITFDVSPLIAPIDRKVKILAVYRCEAG